MYVHVREFVCAEGRRGSQTSRTITLRQDLSGNREIIIVARLPGSVLLCWDSGQVWPCLAFHVDAADPSSGPHTRTASTLLSALSPWPQE